MFVRPCPTTPRHGFVESRVCLTRAEVVTVAKEALAADPNAEIIICEYIDADYNAIVTSANLTIGPGHDGATSGREAITLPLPTSPSLKKLFKASDLVEAGIGEDDDVYLEAVAGSIEAGALVVGSSRPWVATQLRAGPKLNGSIDYIPEAMTVEHVAHCEGLDLLEWETVARELPPGTVVHHPGGGLASHYGVHCVINKVPYIVSFTPEVGQQLEPTKGQSWGEVELERLAQAIHAYEVMELPEVGKFGSQAEAVKLVLGGLHGLSHLMQSSTGTSIRAAGAAIALAMKVFTALVYGEARHAHGYHSNDVARAVIALAANGVPVEVTKNWSRNGVYAEVLTRPYAALMQNAISSLVVFEQKGWEGQMGGKRWLTIARANLKFMDDVRNFIMAPTQPHATEMLNTFNRIVNLVHNNGFWLNKLIPEEVADSLAHVPVLGFVNRHTYPLLTMPLKKRKADFPSVKYQVRKVRELVKCDLYYMLPAFDTYLPLTGAEETNLFFDTPVIDQPLEVVVATKKARRTITVAPKSYLHQLLFAFAHNLKVYRVEGENSPYRLTVRRYLWAGVVLKANGTTKGGSMVYPYVSFDSVPELGAALGGISHESESVANYDPALESVSL